MLLAGIKDRAAVAVGSICWPFQAFCGFANAQGGTLTVGVYKELAQRPTPENLATVITESGLPKMLARNAMDRLAEEMRLLETPANLWLAYNAVNHALFNSRSSLSISDRFRLDEAAFHQLATLALT